MTKSFSIAIIAGGKSSRMGTNKAFVELAGKPLIQHILERTANLEQAETILVTNTPDEYAHLKLPMVADVVPDKGALGGIYTAIRQSKTSYVLVIACDMPFISTELLRYMIAQANDYDVIVPRVDGYPQGLHAIYSKSCLQPIEAQFEKNELKVISFYSKVRVRYFDEDDYAKFDLNLVALMNINTPEDLEKARKLAQSAYHNQNKRGKE